MLLGLLGCRAAAVFPRHVRIFLHLQQGGGGMHLSLMRPFSSTLFACSCVADDARPARPEEFL